MLLKIIGAFFLFLIVIFGCIFLYGINDPNYDVRPSKFHWKKGMTDQEIENTTDSLLKEMPLKEKLNQLAGDWTWNGWLKLSVRFGLLKQYCISYAGRDVKNDIPPLAFTDGPRGVTVGKSTCFPVAMARAASWDPKLELRVGDVLGKEARAAGANYFAGVCINLLRHPGWGRAQEGYGEDPWLMGEMAASVVKGVQQNNVMACAKHFALNSIENARFYVDVKVDDRTLHEVYLPHFQRVIDADVASIMSAYNKVNGTYCGHNKMLLTDILRKEMGFEGFVTSDWLWGIYDGVEAVKAGMDVEMPMEQYSGRKLLKAIENGEIEEDAIDEIAHRIIKTKLKFVTKEDPLEYNDSLVACKEHTELALEVAEKSMVLLKNNNKLLPLNKSKIKKIALVGKLAKEVNTGDKGSSYFKPPYVVSPYDGLKKYLDDKVVYASGDDPEELAKAIDGADAVIVVAGYGPKEEGEYLVNSKEVKNSLSESFKYGGDRFELTLKPEDESLIQKVAALHSDVAVCLVGGSAIIMENWKNEVDGILMYWYGGMEGGTALSRILFGEVNPSGKLPFTIPVSAEQLPDFHPFGEAEEYGYYHGYTLFDKKEMNPAFPFGYGLSYTSFKYDNLIIENASIDENGCLCVNIDITNTGEVAGDEVAQLYIGFENSSVERHKKLLRGFEKIALKPGETKTVEFKIDAKDLAWYDPETKSWKVEKMQYSVLVGGSSIDDQNVNGIFSVVKDSKKQDLNL